MSSIRKQQNDSNHAPWRVILVGRTGLDQILRRDRSIELIRARDTIDAIGELSDPIDTESPSAAVVLVAASIEPSDAELPQFIESLQLIDPTVRVLRVGKLTSAAQSCYDGSIDPRAKHEEIIAQIEQANPIADSEAPSVPLRFVDLSSEAPAQVEPEAEPVAEPVSEAEPELLSDPETEPANTPEVVVVVENENFEHRSQRDFDDEHELHQQVILSSSADESPEVSTPSRPSAQPSGTSSTNAHHILQPAGPIDDQRVVQAMLAGRSILEAAIVLINLRLNREDIEFSTDMQAIGMPITVGSKMLGKLVCADQAWAMSTGHELIAQQAQWLAGWVKLDIQQTELRNAAFTDSLTGAWNRRYFSRFLDAAIVKSREARQPLTVMLFDIDGFKRYNDTYGHAAGDEILIETVKLLKSVIRPSDRVCRVGGDEFVVIFYEPSGPRDPSSKPLESVYQIATRFQKQICTHRFPKLAGEAMGTLTVSGGLASFPWDGHDADSLLEKADQLAMESKRQGKNAMTLGPGAESVCKTPH